MYRYLVFAYLDFYPGGGMKDCIEKTNDVSKVLSIWENNSGYDSIHVYDCNTGDKYDDIALFKQYNE